MFTVDTLSENSIQLKSDPSPGYHPKHNNYVESIGWTFTGDDTVSDILTDMQNFVNNEQVYLDSGQPFKRNYLIIGPPGSGKSSLIAVAASVLNLDIHFISITPNMNEKNICGAISALTTDSLLVIEDIDILCTAAVAGNQGAAIALTSLTNILDGTLHKHKLITILTSANSALEATQIGYEVGTRNVVDLLQSERGLYAAQRDYAKSRYDYVISVLRLKLSVGSLSPEDLFNVSSQMK